MSQNNKPRSTGLKLLLLSIVLVFVMCIPALEPYSVYIFMVAVVLLIVGIIQGIKDVIYNRRLRKAQVSTIPSATSSTSNVLSATSIPTPAATVQPTSTVRPEAPAKTGQTIERVHVRGVENYKKNIISVATENPDYSLTKRELQEDYLDERVWQYQFFVRAALVPEPDNQYDPNAIMVQADGLCIGYVPKGSTAHIRKLMESGRIKHMDLKIGGGKYKEVTEVDDDEYELERGEYNFSAVLELHLSDKFSDEPTDA